MASIAEGPAIKAVAVEEASRALDVPRLSTYVMSLGLEREHLGNEVRPMTSVQNIAVIWLIIMAVLAVVLSSWVLMD